MSRSETEAQKQALMQRYTREGILRSPAVIQSFRRTPRELFLPVGLRSSAYVDTPLPVGWGQTISAPLGPTDRWGRAKHGLHHERSS